MSIKVSATVKDTSFTFGVLLIKSPEHVVRRDEDQEEDRDTPALRWIYMTNNTKETVKAQS